MKKFGSFAVVACLLVLGIAVVLGVSQPGIFTGLRDLFVDLGERIAIFVQHVVDGLLAAVTK